MAKKKKGFFSWLGLGSQDKEQQKEQQGETLPESPLVEEQLGSEHIDDKLPAHESPAAAVVDTPGEWDSTAVSEHAVESVPVVDTHTVNEAPVIDAAVDEPIDSSRVKHEDAEASAVVVEIDADVEDNQRTSMQMDDAAIHIARHEQEEIHSEPISAHVEPTETITPEIMAETEHLQDEVLHDEFADSQKEYDEETLSEDEPEPMQEQERPTKEGFFARLKRSLLKTKQNLGSGFFGLFSGKKIDDELFEELEEQLLLADVGMNTTSKIIDTLTQHASRKQLKDADALYVKLKDEMGEILRAVDQPLDVSGHQPCVILMVGVNGVGKTTTIGKLARQFQSEGKSVMLAAGDTFRAAAVEQLQVWGQRNNIPVIAQHTGADSASVIYDAIQAAKARKIDVLLADTAGRLQNKSHLMEELKKIVRVMKKQDESAPHEIMLTIDASTGQNAVSQVKLFHEAVGLTGITLTKLDGTAKGGVIFAVADQFGIPIRYIGVGEGIKDLRPFKADDFIEALFARED